MLQVTRFQIWRPVNLDAAKFKLIAEVAVQSVANGKEDVSETQKLN